MEDVARDRDKNHIMSFKSFIINTSSIDVDNLDNVERHVISRVCAEYYKKVKSLLNSEKIPKKILEPGKNSEKNSELFSSSEIQQNFFSS